jgi:Fic family protein
MIFDEPPLDAHTLDVLAQITDLRIRLRHQVSEPCQWTGMLRRVSFAKAIQSSNSIEGYHVTLDDAVAVTDDDDPVEAEGETLRAVACYRDALTYILQLADDPHYHCSPDLIRSLHYMMMKYDLDKRPGRWRAGAIYVHDEATDERVYEGPDAEQVPHLMEQLAVTLQENSRADALIRGAMAHLNLAMIHPFRDGNGRMARALQTLVLAREQILAPMFCSIEEYLGDNTQEYYAVLATVGQGGWNPQHDALPWIRFCLIAHHRQARALLARVKLYERMWHDIERRAARHGLPERAVPALLYAAAGGRLRRSSYVSMAGDITDDTGSRDLKACVEAGLILAHGERRGRYYTGAEDLRRDWAAAKQALRERPIDPFQEPALPIE